MRNRRKIQKTVFLLCLTVLLLVPSFSCFSLTAAAWNDDRCDYITQTNVTPLHEMGITGKYEDGTPVRVVVIDTGVDYRNFAFTDENGNCIISPLSYNASTKQTAAEYGYAVIDDQADAKYHGTSVIGTIVSRLDSAPGVAPDVELIAVRCDYREFYEGAGMAYLSEDLVHAVEYAVSLDPDVISISWTISQNDRNSEKLKALLQEARDKNILVCVSAGNDGISSLDLPASLDTVLTVGWLNADNTLNSASSYGPDLDLTAPGSVLGVKYGGGVWNMDGTSFATPIVAGIAALYISMHPDATVDDITAALCSTAKDLGTFGRDDKYGYGIPDAFAACWAGKASLTLICGDNVSELAYFPGGLDKLNEIVPTTGGGIFTGWYYDEAFTQPVCEGDIFWNDTTLYGGVQYTWTLYDGYTNVIASVTDYPGTALTYPERAGFIRWTEDEMPTVLERKNSAVHLFWTLMDLEVQYTPTDVTATADKRIADGFTFAVTHPLADRITYQWFRDGVILPDETTEVLFLACAKDNSGTYTCVATLNAGGQIRTASCTFTVTYEAPSRLPMVLLAAISVCSLSCAVVSRKRKKKNTDNNV